ncbi:tyrosine-protein phosphatase 69D-like isoform X2 [Diabrotica virgifera virgifera]|nr:tyrosine-protein phosphatase 69D-like isoform X2 [Diabrotica virgifera virgifera]
MLGGSSGTVSAIRKCSTNPVPVSLKNYAEGSCKLNHNPIKDNPLDENNWKHFVIQKFRSRLRLLIYRGKKDGLTPYLFLDDQYYIIPKKLFVHYKVKTGHALWKFHKYYNFESKGEGVLSSPPFQVPNGIICISMFVKTSSKGTLSIQVKDRNALNAMDTRELNTNNTWQEVGMIIKDDNKENKLYQVNFVHYASEEDTCAVDGIRECNEIEYRYIKHEEGGSLSCQRLEDPLTVTIKKLTPTTNKETNCSESTFGENCIPCGIFGEPYCKSFNYCELRTLKCFCTAGYQNDNCEECPDKFYGHGCKKFSRCKIWDKYSNINGYCSKGYCEYPYIGNRCQDVEFPFFLNPPTIYKVTTRGFTIVQDNLTREGYAESYHFQYSEAGKEDWKRINPDISVDISQAVEVYNGDISIEPDTEYIVRAILKKEKGGKSLRSKSNTTANVLTGCIDLTENEIRITPENTTAHIELLFSSDHCQYQKYQVKVDNGEYKYITSSLDVDNFHVKNLKPYTPHTFYVKYTSNSKNALIIKKDFMTRQAKPSEITNYKSSATSTTVSLSWEKPDKANGIISGYVIRYKVLRNLACKKDKESTFSNVTTSETSLTLNYLEPYTRYNVHIQAKNDEFLGEIFSATVETLPLNIITEQETLSINNIIPKSDGATVTIKDLICSSLFGPLDIQFEVTCLSNWCRTEAPTNFNRSYDPNNFRFDVSGSSILPFTDYVMAVKIHRNSAWNYSEYRNFTTLPSVANKIYGVEKYNNSENSISLRWKPPYPPTGILEKYFIIYGWRSTSEEVAIKECTFWKGYHCATIDKQISFKTTYQIQVSAINKDQGYGPYSDPIKVYIGEEAPSVVYNLEAMWTPKNDLNISFYHPNDTNGQLRSFEIIMNDNYNFPIRQFVTEYMPIYQYQIDSPKFTECDTLPLKVRAHNIHNPSKFVSISVDTPPSLPEDIEKIEGNSTNTTITLGIKIKETMKRVDMCNIFVSTNQMEEEGTQTLTVEEFNKYFSRNNTRRVYTSTKNVNSTINLIIGDNDDAENIALNPGTKYSLIVILSNKCKNNNLTQSRIKQIFIQTMGNYVKPIIVTTTETPTTGKSENVAVSGLWALLLLLILPIALIWYIKKKHPNIPQMIKPQPKLPQEDQIVLTDTPLVTKPTIKAIKPTPSVMVQGPKTKNSKKVKIIDLETYVKESITNGEFQRQHELFPKGLLKPHSVGSTAENKIKNRYKNLVAYDHSRVKLKRSSGDNQSDYINANYIDGYRQRKAYIATQGPKANTLTDFWMMIWQKNVRDIIMLANIYENGKKKVEKYWPEINEDKHYGDYKVHYVSSSVHANFEERKFTLSHNNEQRQITQLHFTTWPDHGVPLYSQSLVPFLQKILKIPYSAQSPMIVHCSAGVGRTGTIILSDIILRMAAAENSVDFLAYLEIIRDQRSNLVDNLEQYKLAHLVVLECLFGMRTSIMCNDDMRTIVENTISNNGIRTQMKYIEETQWQDSAMETILDNEEVAPIYDEKNRFKDIIPEHYRVFVTRYPHDDETSSYINAILVDDFRNPGRYIVTQQPMPNTIGDFWRMVLERSCNVIISLNTIDLKDETVCQVWPEKNEELNPVDFIKIVHKKTRRLEFYSIITVELVTQLTEVENTTVNIIALDNWRHEDLLPNSIEEFLAFKDAAEALSRTSESILVMCYDGAKASGLYLALSFIIEKMKLEQECDVCLAVRTVRHSRKQFVTTEEQYEFLYRASLTFITGFQPYSNFA